ncbi:hypothetical protein DPMN_189052 [Dreissena polymorpha]|uniref:Uncharacterized protein n=1 Tax=Dreissena polymorpha TaxID=45954 RepID=A0A9D4DUW1_DREPO|nr:hypothetical protein DPMN_189052 [Dreissena polymorpha]
MGQKIKEQLKRLMQKCRFSKVDTSAVDSWDSSSITDRLGLYSKASKLSKGNIKLLTLLLMKKGSNDLTVNTQSTIHQWGMPQT